MTAPVSRVGAPLIEAFAPPIDSAEGAFHFWLNANRSRVHGWLDLVTRRWKPLGSFVELNYVHPQLGPSGAVVMTSQAVDLRTVRHRVTRLTVIPHSEVAPYVPRWRRGATVLVAVADMPERLALRYANTPVEWSLNVPIFVRGTWVGLVGAVATARGLGPAVASYQALADLMMRDFAARDAWQDFRATLDDNRFPQGLHRETDERGTGIAAHPAKQPRSR